MEASSSLPPHPMQRTAATAQTENQRLRRLLDGKARFDSGDFAGAQAIAEQATLAAPGDQDAWHLLGVALARQGALDRSASCLQRAIALAPGIADFHLHLGNVELERQRLAAAIGCYQRAAALDPQSERPRRALALACERQLDAGIEHQRAGRRDEARACYESVLTGQPARADALHLLGLLAYATGDLAAALQRVDAALRVAPNASAFHESRGIILLAGDRIGDAQESFAAALRLQPKSASHLFNAALAQRRRRDDAAAEASIRAAIASEPNHLEARTLLAELYCDMRRLDEADREIASVLALAPERAAAHALRGRVCRERGHHRDALLALQRALSLDASLGAAHNLLGQVLKDQGRAAEAIDAYRHAVELDPQNPVIGSNLLFALNYATDIAPDTVFAEHRAWPTRHGPAAPPPALPPSPPLDPGRRLKIGFVSADLCAHAVASFLEPLLAARDRAALEVCCYANNASSDAVSTRLAALADSWHRIAGRTDDEVAARIRADGIDILVDLSGHTRGNRMPLFARRVAAIQVTWIGYPNTTGLATMDYRLTDCWADPPGLTESLHSETLFRLPGGFLCFAPQREAPPVAPSPALASGRITFASFNNLAKVNAELIGRWAAILHAVPGSRMLLKAKPLADPGTRALVATAFSRHAVPPERLELVGWVDGTQHHLEHYARVDIALDTFPYHGTTTTCEALWMGVPVITWAGEVHAARVGVSLLHSIGHPELVATSGDDYVATAVALARDVERLRRLRAELRPTVAASALTDTARIASEVEAAFRRMWRRRLRPA